MSLQISFKQEGDIHIIRLKGRFVGSETKYFLEAIDHKLGNIKQAKLVLDLSELDYLGTQGASALLSLSSRCQVKIAQPSSMVKDTLLVLKFDKFFEIYDEVKNTLASFELSHLKKYEPERVKVYPDP